MDVLNIDALVQPKRSLTLKGVDYPIVELDVQAFCDNLAAAEALEKAEVTAKLDNADVSAAKSLRDHIELSYAQIEASVPGVPMEEIRKLPLSVVGAIMAHIRGDVKVSAEPASEGDAAKKSN